MKARAPKAAARTDLRSPRWAAAALALLPFVVIVAATAWAFWPVLSNGLVNWDDPDVFTDNANLLQRGRALVTWAFSTRLMGHYQPLSWLTLAYLSTTPPDAWRIHAASLALHALNACLLFWCCRSFTRADAAPGHGASGRWAAFAGSLLFALHPLRVEPVAWASASPYLLSHALLLGVVASWIAWCRRGQPVWLWVAVGTFALSQLARVTAPLFPLVLAALARADGRAIKRPTAALVRALAPCAVIAIALAVAEASTRSVEDMATVGLAARVASALTHPGVYLWHTLFPVDLTPLDPLPRVPVADWGRAVLALGGIGAAIAAMWRLVSPRVAVAVWGSYLLLLVPVVGLTPSGLQATADRYTYGPALVLSLALAALLSRMPVVWARGGALAAVIVAAIFGSMSHAQATVWHDSVSLWSRAVALNGDNDVAIYNLAQALSSAGQSDMAIAQYQRLLALVPDHDLGGSQVAALLATREQKAADAAAAAGRLDDAIAGYDRTLQHDPARVRARVNRGMALISRGDLERGAADLEASGVNDAADPALVGALAFAWSETGRAQDAVALLTGAQRRHPDELGLAVNLARLLVVAQPKALRDPAAALALAARANDATGGRDPRVLDTLALALAATGRSRDALQALDVAITLARESGDAAQASELARRRSTLAR